MKILLPPVYFLPPSAYSFYDGATVMGVTIPAFLVGCFYGQAEAARWTRDDPGRMRDLGVKRLIASCLNDARRHTALIEVWSYPAETEIPGLPTPTPTLMTPRANRKPAGEIELGITRLSLEGSSSAAA
jgi:hypothetical protein